jgi:hypothetical protein
MPDSPFRFTPVRTASTRIDGWTAERQAGFIAALADSGSVADAARMMGKGTASVYRLRKRPGAASFAAAWDAALYEGRDRMFLIRLRSSLGPEVAARFYRGHFASLTVRQAREAPK